MKITKTKIPDLLIVEPEVFYDQRGYFYESYNKKKFTLAGIGYEFMQDNQSMSKKNVLRGLHFQKPPFAQSKLVRVINGSVLDVAVDIRKKSSFYGKYVSIVLSEHNKLMFWIPQGFAHGFLSIEDDTIFSYKCTQTYNKNSEHTILWNDSNLNIDWELANPIVSEKDKKATCFKNFISPF